MSIIQTGIQKVKSKISQFIGNLIYKKVMPGFGGKVIGRDNWPGPLETGAKYDPKFASRLEHSEYMFKSHQYPQGIGNVDEGHYMAFMVIERKKAGTAQQNLVPSFMQGQDNKMSLSGDRVFNSINRMSDGGSRLLANKNIFVPRGVRSGMRTKAAKEVEILTNMIFLYTPAGIGTNYGIEYSPVETGMFGAVSKGVSGLPAGVSKTLKSFGAQFKEHGIMGALQHTSYADLMSAGNDAFKAGGALTRSIVENIVGEGLKAAGQASLNTMGNPHMELMMVAPQFRSFTFSYTFAPRNQTELDSTHNIIKTFKYHMLPSIVGERTEHVLDLPSQFEVRYMFKHKENLYLPKISRCYCDSVDVNYTPNDKFTTFKGDGKGASPNIIKMGLKFTEMEIMTKDTIASGY